MRSTLEENPRELRAATAPIVFVGGTGRSGTHVIAKLLAKNVSLGLIPVECRFHVEDRGFPGLLAGEVSKRRFLRRMRGFWWKGFQRGRFRGMHRFVKPDRFDAALAAFDERFDSDSEEACRRLFLDLLWFRAERKGAEGIIEQSCDVIAAAPTLVRLFPEARFIHVVRDGRDASASRVAQTHGLIYPRTRAQGLEWWEARIRRIDAGARSIPDGRLLELSIDELVAMSGPKTLHPLCRFAGIGTGHRVRAYFKRKINAERGNQGRWRAGMSGRRAAEIEQRYGAIVDGLEADGVSCAPMLRRTFERSRADGQAAEPPLAYVGAGEVAAP